MRKLSVPDRELSGNRREDFQDDLIVYFLSVFPKEKPRKGDKRRIFTDATFMRMEEDHMKNGRVFEKYKGKKA